MKLIIAGHGPVRDKLVKLLALSFDNPKLSLQPKLELAGYELRSKGITAETFRTADYVIALDLDSLRAATGHIGAKTVIFYDPHTISETKAQKVDGIGVPVEAHATSRERLEESFAPFVFFGALSCMIPLLGYERGRSGLQKAVAHEYYQNKNRHLLAFTLGWEASLPQRLQLM